jgi:copper transport protein
VHHPVGSRTGGLEPSPPVARPHSRRRPGRSRAGRGLGAGGRLGAAALLAGLWLVVAGATAGAHALLEASDPAGGATLDAAPRQVLLTFTERPEPRLSSVRVLDTAGNEVGSGPAAPVPGQPRQLSAPLGELPDGTYTVSWRVVSKDDGHVTAGTLAFGVGVPAPAAAAEGGEPAAAGEARAPGPLAVAGRWALYAGLLLLVGAAATGLAVFGRVLPAGARVLLGSAAALAVAGVAARFLAERAAIDASFADLFGTSTGQGLLRLGGAVLVAAVAAAVLAARPSGWWRLGLVGAAAGGAMLLHVLAGHAAGPSSLRSLNLLAQWVHVVAVGIWIGGLVWLLAGLRGRERPQQVAAAVRFSKLAAPVLAVVALTGLARTVDLSGGWTGLVESGYGRLLDLKVLLFLGLVVLGALHHYRVIPGLRSGREPDRAAPAATARPGLLDRLRRGVRVEVVLAVGVLAATAILSQLPPGKFVVGRAAARPAPPSVQVEGNDFATSVRVGLTVSPGTAGPNAFTAKVTDYDSGEPWPAERVALRFTPRDQPDVGQATLELTHDHQQELWRGQGSPLSIEGRWVVVALIEGSGPAVTVPLELETRPTPQQVEVSQVPGQPTLYTITLAAGGTLQTYIDPGKPGANTVHFTFFTPGGDERPASKASATMAKGSGGPEPLELLRLGPGHFAANLDLEPGRASFAIQATAGGKQTGGRFEQVIE